MTVALIVGNIMLFIIAGNCKLPFDRCCTCPKVKLVVKEQKPRTDINK